MSWQEIKDQIEKNGNVKTFSMDILRDAYGAQKLGVNVRNAISQEPAGIGLGHVPIELPSHQHEQVRLYKRGAPVGQLIEAVLTPGEQNDKSLSEKFGIDAPDYATLVEKIRELVSE